MTDSGTKTASVKSSEKKITSAHKTRAAAATKPNTLKSAPAPEKKDRVDAADKICESPSGSSLGPRKGKDGPATSKRINARDTSSSDGGNTGISRQVESNNNSNSRSGNCGVGSVDFEDIKNNNNIVDADPAHTVGIDNRTSSSGNDCGGTAVSIIASLKPSDDDKDTLKAVNQSAKCGSERNPVIKTSEARDTAVKCSDSSDLVVSSSSKTDENQPENTESNLPQQKPDVSVHPASAKDSSYEALTETEVNTISTTDTKNSNSCLIRAANLQTDVRDESQSKRGGNEGGADTTGSSCEDIPDRYSLEEERSGGAAKGLSALAGNWEKYFVRVGDWLISATEGADSNPPSDHEEEGAAGDANKAGFASGLANFNLSGVSSRASASAKTVGSFFGTAFSKASASVKEAGSKIKETVEKTPLLSEFNKEQEAFIAAKGGKVGEALPPWVGYPEEDKLKEEILGLATERKNFVRNPPTGVIFEFDLEQFLPVAQATLAADPNLEKMRFELVPKVVTEEVFWRNYFYRVGLIRQSEELSSLEQDGASDTPSKQATDNKVAAAPPPPPSESTSSTTAAALEAAASDAPEFVSESFQPSSEDVEEVKRGVSSLTGAAEKGEEDWEAELREELGGFEVVEGQGGKGGNGGKGDDQWEEEIQNMIDEEEDDSGDLR